MIPNFYSTEEFESKFTYHGSDLGATWTPEKTSFRIWAPTAVNVMVNLYRSGNPSAEDLLEQLKMTASDNGTWVAEKAGDLNGVYYTYLVFFDDHAVEACDPYARTTGVNGQRAMVIDLRSTDPVGWEADCDPHAGAPITDAVIYELHIRDLSMDACSGIHHKGKYLGMIESGTTTPDGKATGLDHMKALGVTHVHILPMYDFGFTDETLPLPQYNWGYDPVNYNVPEGSYASDPYHGEVRVKEVKQMVKGLHDAGLSVIMDVVYNHVYEAHDFCFNQIVPMYFSRFNHYGVLVNTSGCGNDTASERSMVSKYIVDSVKYWADEYHIDGFRFDLVGLIDTDTINTIVSEVHKTHPNVIFYGEGWNMAAGITKPDIHMTVQGNAHMVPGFAFFNDTIRDQLKGSVFQTEDRGFVSGGHFSREELIKCFKGATDWAPCPGQSINYVSCHDNNTLIDRLSISNPADPREKRIKMNNLAAAFTLLSQGVPFFHAGEELLRTKPAYGGGFDHNSYRAPDAVNAFKWSDLSDEQVSAVHQYYQGLIRFRKAHPDLRLTTREEVDNAIHVLPCGNDRILAFRITKNTDMIVIFNGDDRTAEVELPEGIWDIHVADQQAGTAVLGVAVGAVKISPISTTVLLKRNPQSKTHVPALTGVLATAAAIGAAVGSWAAMKKRKKQS